MKKQLLRAAALLAVALTTASSGLANTALTTYNPGDLFLGFRKTDVANSLAVKIGPATQFLPANLGGTNSNNAPFKVQFGVLPGSSVVVSNLNADLTSVFEPGWTNNPTNGSGVRWAVVGFTDNSLDNVPISGLNARSIFVTRARTNPAVQSTVLTYSDTAQKNLFAQQFAPFAYGTGEGAYVNNQSTPNSSVAFIGSAAAPNNWNTKIQANGSFGLGSVHRVEQASLGNFTGPTDSVLDLYLAPYGGSTLATNTTYLGSFTLYRNGELIFWPGASNAPVPVVNVAVSPINGSVGTLFQYQISVSNFPTAYAASNLPAGLTVDTNTGLISGIPTTAGTNNVELSAANPFGSGSNSLTLGFAPPAPPDISSAATANGQVGQLFSYQITAIGNPTSYGAEPLPPGLTVNTNTGLISGTPTTAGTSTINISASNPGGTGSAALSLTISAASIQAPAITSPGTASGTAGTAFNYQITASGNPTNFSATGLPTGLSINASTGLISGTPTAAGASTINISASNPGGTGSAALSLTIAGASGTKKQTISFRLPPRLVFGTTYTLRGSSTSKLRVTYAVSDPTAAELVGNKLKILKVAPFTVSATQAGNTRWATANPVTRDASPVKASQAIAFTVKPTTKVGQPPVSLKISLRSQLPVTVVSSDPTILSVDNTNKTATALKKGRVTLTATQDGNESYAAAKPIKRTVTVR